MKSEEWRVESEERRVESGEWRVKRARRGKDCGGKKPCVWRASKTENLTSIRRGEACLARKRQPYNAVFGLTTHHGRGVPRP